MAALASAFPNFPLTDPTIRIYGRVLADIEDDLLEKAALDCLSRVRFFPSPGELRDAAFAIRRPQLPSAFEAWGEVVDQIRSVGFYGTPSFSSPRIETAVRQVGGWQMLCLSENAVADRARFLEAYQDTERRTDTSEKMLPEVKDLALRLSADRRLLQDREAKP
jgi:hypothetical protein